MDVRLVINGQSFSPILRSYAHKKEIGYEAVITTLDQTEHPIGEFSRDVLTFQLYCQRQACANDFRALMQRPLMVEYDDADTGIRKTRRFRIDGDLEKTFELKSPIYGDIYSSAEITLRCLEVDR